MEAQFTYHSWLVFVFRGKNIFLFYLNATSPGNKHVVVSMYLNYLFDNFAFLKTSFLSRNNVVRLLESKRQRLFQAYKNSGEVALSFFTNLVYEALLEYSIISFGCKCLGVKCFYCISTVKVFPELFLSFLKMRTVLEMSNVVVFCCMSSFYQLWQNKYTFLPLN